MELNKKKADRVYKLLKGCSFNIESFKERFKITEEERLSYNIIYGWYNPKL